AASPSYFPGRRFYEPVPASPAVGMLLEAHPLVSPVGSVAGRARENPYPFASLTHRGFRGWLTQSGRPRRPKIPERPLRRDFIGLRCQPPYPRLACLGGKHYTAHPLPPPMHRHCLGEIAFRHG